MNMYKNKRKINESERGKIITAVGYEEGKRTVKTEYVKFKKRVMQGSLKLKTLLD